MSHQVSLQWTASTDAVDGYNIYRGSAAGAENVKLNTALVTVTTFVDTVAPLGHDYYVVKSSVGGVESLASNEVNTTILPAPPTGLTIIASS